MVPWITIICSLIIFNVEVNGVHLSSITPSSSPLQTVAQWNVADFNFEWNAPVNDKDFYNPENVVATGIAIGYDKIFVATPRLFSGVPSTLNTFSRNQVGNQPVLQVSKK